MYSSTNFISIFQHDIANNHATLSLNKNAQNKPTLYKRHSDPQEINGYHKESISIALKTLFEMEIFTEIDFP